MSKASESELLVEPPRHLELTPKGGDMGKRQPNPVLVETKVQPLWSRGTDCQVGKGNPRLSSLQGEGIGE